MCEIEVIGNYMPSEHNASRVVDTNGLAPTVKENHGTVTGIVDVRCVAMRGRDAENPNFRGPANENFEQRLEPRADGCTNTITTVQKDNLIIENEPICLNSKGGRGGFAPEEWTWEIDGTRYLIRIRKLTPRECWRLMDFSDEDFEKAESVNSNAQLYKQAGNSIVRNCLCEIFSNLFSEEEEEMDNRELFLSALEGIKNDDSFDEWSEKTPDAAVNKMIAWECAEEAAGLLSEANEEPCTGKGNSLTLPDVIDELDKARGHAEAINIAKIAVRRLIPVRPVHENDYYVCPVCDELIGWGQGCCDTCYQVLDWGPNRRQSGFVPMGK